MGLRMCSRLPCSQSTILIVMLLNVFRVALSTKMHYIHWNTTNSIFRIDNTDHIIDVNKGNIPFEYDQVNIICPVYSKDTREEEAEKYIIYNVSKEEYDSCRITTPAPRVIAVCDKPFKLMYFTITFRSFTPQPGGLEFKPGQDYYFISTSSRDDLHRRIGGRCNTHHMKVVFKVCCDPASQPIRDQEDNRIPNNGLSTPRGTTTTTMSTTKRTTTTTTPKTTTTTAPSTSLSTTSLKTTSRKNYPMTTTKKVDYDRSLNEILKAKQGSSGASDTGGGISLCAIALVGVLVQYLLTNINTDVKCR